MLWPSPLVFFSASLIWTLLEYIHYQSNAEDDYQKLVLGGAVVFGLLPFFGCDSKALGVLICTMPWSLHFGLVISDLLHSIWRQRSHTATMTVPPYDELTTRL
jgi:hypothetical protein